jgi:hypothetical protein
MTLRIIRRSLMSAVSAAVLIGSINPAAAADNKSVPFNAGFVVTEVLGPPDQSCYLTAPPGGSAAIGNIIGHGVAGRIGRFAVQAQDCITSSSPPAAFQPPVIFKSRFFSIQAAGGTIFGQYEGMGVEQPKGVLVLSGTFTITGGTGRFVGATGQGKIEGMEDISGGFTQPATGSYQLTGQITY